MALPLFCGDPMCKKAVALEAGKSPPWPVRCRACGIALYPHDIIEASRPDDLEPRRGRLMSEVDGRRVAVVSAQLTDTSVTTRDSGDIDRVLSLVDLGDEKATRGGKTWLLVAFALALLVAAALAYASWAR